MIAGSSLHVSKFLLTYPSRVSVCRAILCGFFIYISIQVYGQNPGALGNYSQLIVEIPLTQKLSLYSDNEIRAAHVFNKFYHTEIKAGVRLKLSPAIALTFAGGLYRNFNGGPDYDDQVTYSEYRIWQQIAHKSMVSRLVVENRLRVEEIVTKKFTPVVRYRLQGKLPINASALDAGAIYLVLYDELFVGLRSFGLSKNRFFGGMGLQWSKDVGFHAGFMRQTENGGGRSKNFLHGQLSVKL